MKVDTFDLKEFLIEGANLILSAEEIPYTDIKYLADHIGGSGSQITIRKAGAISADNLRDLVTSTGRGSLTLDFS